MPLTGIETAITSVVERATPSVVTIATVEVRRADRAGPASGVGSGVVVRGDGLVVTNYHVVARARSAEVVFADGRRAQAEFVGGDPGFDLALLRVPLRDLAPLPLADSDALKVGQLAIAIGSPFGHVLQGPTVTVGVVSALRRSLPVGRGATDGLIQTDAPINPGNSGGPLLDTRGEAIGINTAIIPYAQGIGFAVPSNAVRDAVDELLAFGRVVHPWVGVAGLTVTPPVAERFQLPEPDGVVVVGVEPASPAHRAGLVEGDVLVEVDGRRLATVEDLRMRVRTKKPGEALEATFVRRGRRKAVTIRVAERSA